MFRKLSYIIPLVLLLGMALTNVASAVQYVETPMVDDLNGGGFKIYNLSDIITKGPWRDVGAYSSFSAAIDDINEAEKTLLIPDSEVVDVNKTVPSNITLCFLQGGKLNISSGKTVTINGPIEAGLHHIFTGAGDVSFGSGCYKEVYPQWWGAKGDGSKDDTAALQAAFDSIASAEYLGTGQRLVIPTGLYDFNDTLTLDENFAILECHGTLKWTSDANIIAVMIGSSDSKWGIRASLRLHHDPYTWSTGATGIQVKNLTDSHITIERCVGFETGLQLVGDAHGTAYNQFRLDCIVENKIGIDFECVNGGWVNENTFYGGRFAYYSGGHQASYEGSRFVNIPYDPTHIINNNTFYSPSFECAWESDPNYDPNNQPGYFVYCAGAFNAFIHPRDEGDAAIKNVYLRGRGNLWIGGAWTEDVTKFDIGGYCNRIETESVRKWGQLTENAQYGTITAPGTIEGGSITTAGTIQGEKFTSTGCTATGTKAVALGTLTEASGTYSTAMGYDTTASGSYSTAMGKWTNAIGDYSTVMGTAGLASGYASTAMGFITGATGDYSTATGYSVSAGSANYTTAIGKSFANNVQDSFAVGFGKKDFLSRK